MSALAAEVDRCLDALLNDPDFHAPAAGRCVPVAQPLETPRGSLDAAVEFFRQEQFARCRALLPHLRGAEAADVRAEALEVACAALVQGRLRGGVRACQRLLDAHPDRPDLHWILGSLLVRARRRREAHRLFQRALDRFPDHPRLLERLEGMGRRRPPVLGFLPRSHPANRWLGRLRHRLAPR